jgi:hypothetical protein
MISLSMMAQTHNVSYFKITQKECLRRSGYTLVLKQVVSDSRCPQGLNCIWAGEAQVIVSVYNNKKLVEDVAITFSPKMVLENNKWFARYSKDKYKDIQNVALVPYPQKDVVLKPKDYYLKIGYHK